MTISIHEKMAATLPGHTCATVSLRNSAALLFVICIVGFAPRINAQTVSHPLSEMSSTVRHYSYTHMLSPTTKKELEYIIVKASNGEIKTVFNACDVCYPYHKGYSQAGTEVRCNNCGNRFAIDGLGVQSSGTCNPGYLPHAIQGGDVVIKVSDLVVGAYYFLTQTVTALETVPETPSVLVTTHDRRHVTVLLSAEGERSFHIFSVTGQHCASVGSASKIVDIDIAGLAAGAYLLAIQDARTVKTASFLVY